MVCNVDIEVLCCADVSEMLSIRAVLFRLDALGNRGMSGCEINRLPYSYPTVTLQYRQPKY